MSDREPLYGCASCHTAAAFRGDCNRMPASCPTLTRLDLTKDVAPYLEPERAELMRVADLAPFEHLHQKRTRVGAVDYDEIGLTKAHPERFASICNPVAQAKLLNEAGVQLIVQLGLCLGHDLILQEEACVPVTTLVVKDRALDHHPIEALRP